MGRGEISGYLGRRGIEGEGRYGEKIWGEGG